MSAVKSGVGKEGGRVRDEGGEMDGGKEGGKEEEGLPSLFLFHLRPQTLIGIVLPTFRVGLPCPLNLSANDLVETSRCISWEL